MYLTSQTTYRAEYRLQGDRDDSTAWIAVGTYTDHKWARRALDYARACGHETRVVPMQGIQDE